jgi:lipoprotein-releasing system permease protein
MNYHILLALRYLFHSAYDKTISTMTIICFMSILLSSFSLALIAAIRQGFEQAIHEKIQGIHAHIIIRNAQDALNIPAIEHVIKTEFPAVAAYAASATAHVIMQPTQHCAEPAMVMLKGIDPEQEHKISSIAQKIMHVQKPFLSSFIHDNYVLVGKTLAHDLDLVPTDQITFFFTDDIQPQHKNISLKTMRAIVSGIFDTGIDEFDTGVVYCSLPFLKELFPSLVPTQMYLRIMPGNNEEHVAKQLRNRLQLTVYSWKELYPALFSALTLEKYAMLFILGLIIIIATMNMISLFYMHITQKRSDIALLKALGASNKSIMIVFFIMGIMLTACAAGTGLTIAYIVCKFLEYIPFIPLPDVYYVSHLPAKIDWYILAAVFIFNTLLCIIALWLPIKRTITITITQLLRFER